MTDTHTHLYMLSESADECTAAVARAIDAGVDMMVFPAVDPASYPSLMELHRRFPGNTAVAVGIHPTELGADWETGLEEICRHGDPLSPVAVGETGIDLYWEKETLPQQKEAFHKQLLMGLERGLPVIIHCRDAREEVLEVISEVKESHGGELPKLIFHSFTGGTVDVVRIREVCDPWFGINGVVTFKNARDLTEAIPEIGLQRLLLETDSPYLSPFPHRGKPNESARLPLIRDRVAAILGLPPSEIEQATDANAALAFGFKSSS